MSMTVFSVAVQVGALARDSTFAVWIIHFVLYALCFLRHRGEPTGAMAHTK